MENEQAFEKWFQKSNYQAIQGDDLTHVILDCSVMNYIDMTGVEALTAIYESIQLRNENQRLEVMFVWFIGNVLHFLRA